MSYYDPDRGEDLRTALDDLVLDWSGVESRTMFGCPSYRAAGTIFALVVTVVLVLTRLPERERTELAETVETHAFEANGRTVSGWIVAAVDAPDDLVDLRRFVRSSYDAAHAETGA